jgi:hypothetical protein
MALAWVLRGGGITSALIGASRPEQVEDCVGAIGNLDFTADELAQIDRYREEKDINLWAILAAAAAVTLSLVSGSTALAVSFTIAGGTNYALPGNYSLSLQTGPELQVGTVVMRNGTLALTAPGRVTFTYLGSEAGYSNRFTADGGSFHNKSGTNAAFTTRISSPGCSASPSAPTIRPDRWRTAQAAAGTTASRCSGRPGTRDGSTHSSTTPRPRTRTTTIWSSVSTSRRYRCRRRPGCSSPGSAACDSRRGATGPDPVLPGGPSDGASGEGMPTRGNTG